jgi:ParB family chromosome partitioning protein
MSNPKNLGRGLSALFGDLGFEQDDAGPKETNQIPINAIEAGRMQPRKEFNPEKMADLIASIRSKGVLQPLLLRPRGENIYEIIAGERRWRAAKEAGLTSVPAIVMPCTDEEALQIGLIENLQRDDLGPMEEAESLKKLIENYGKTQEHVAHALGKSRSYVANILRLNGLPESVKTMLRQGELSAGHARSLINADNIDEIAQKIVSEKLSVRDAENLARASKTGLRNGNSQFSPNYAYNKEASSPWKQDDPILADAQMIAGKIGRALGVHAKLVIKNNTGVLSLHFHHLEQLDDLVNILARSGFD